MRPIELIKKASTEFSKLNCDFCLVGGHAASLYRTQERLTRDVDFAIYDANNSRALSLAEKVIKGLGLSFIQGHIPIGKSETRTKGVCMVTSSPGPGEISGVIDILLPALPWVQDAVVRARDNRIKLGRVSVPVITAEDLIIAKCYALRNSPDRFQDLDDLKEIFLNRKDMDFPYIKQQLRKFALEIPKAVRKYSPLKRA